ncbi:MAG TPA: SDR family NAD(P)-dependent oxidoreductase [Pirellulales bacterium]
MSPREATVMDPQQRLLLEVGWEALEDAGIRPGGLAGSNTGVFIGISIHDYWTRMTRARSLEQTDQLAIIGNAFCFAPGRLSYHLDLRGPSICVDTACSSSLVAIQLACESLWKGESSLALAGGVNLLLAPDMNHHLSHMGVLSTFGRCSSFSAGADGFVRSDGCGVVVLMRLRDAIAAGRSIFATIAGAAVNHGGASSGLTVPNGVAQQALIRRALVESGLDPVDVEYVETHGTGTLIGDPIEAHALGAVLGEGRSADRPCLIGSVKSNIGHCESAAGVAGLIKTVLMLHHGQIVPTLHYDRPNPHIAFDELRLKVATTLSPWTQQPGRSVPLTAGVSSFGLSGTNAHVIVQQWAPLANAAGADNRNASGDSDKMLLISAKTPAALRTLARRYDELIEHNVEPQPDALRRLADVCDAANSEHEQFPVRAAVPGSTFADLRQQLRTIANGEASIVDQVPKAGVVFLFEGARSVPEQLCRRLIESNVVFSKAMREAAAEFSVSPENIASFASGAPQPDGAGQLPNFFRSVVVQIAIAKVWRACGIEPRCAIGVDEGRLAVRWLAGDRDYRSESWHARDLAPCIEWHPGDPPDSFQSRVDLVDGLKQIDSDAVVLSMGSGLREESTLVASLKPEGGELSCLADAASQLFLRGVDVLWPPDLTRASLSTTATANDRKRVRLPFQLPNYPWERKRYWLDFPGPEEAAATALTKPDPRSSAAPSLSAELRIRCLTWEPLPITKGACERASTVCVVVRTDNEADGRIACRLAAALAVDGKEPIDVVVGLQDDRGLPRLIEQLRAQKDWDVVVLLPRVNSPEDGGGPEADYFNATGVCAWFTRIVQVLANAAAVQTSRTVVVTRAARRVVSTDLRCDVGSAAVWGLALTFMREHPERHCQLVDLPGTVNEDSDVRSLARQLTAQTPAQVAWRETTCYSAGWQSVTGSRPGRARELIRADRSYLITGGFGGLAPQLARWLVSRGARHIALLGRRSSQLPAWAAEMQHGGAHLRPLCADVTSPSQVSGALALMSREMPPLHGVIHAAGVLQDALVANLQPQTIANAMAPKLLGAASLASLIKERDLGFFWAFSSLAASIGAVGQAAYASANAALDALCDNLRQDGLPALSIAWGPWEGAGMAARLASIYQRRLLARGLKPLGQADAQIALDAIAGYDGAHLAVYQGEDIPSLTRTESLGADLTSSGDVVAAIAEVFGLSASTLADHVTLESVGLDSLLAIDVRNRLSRRWGVDLSLSTLLSGITVGQIVDLVKSRISQAGASKEGAISGKENDVLQIERGEI